MDAKQQGNHRHNDQRHHAGLHIGRVEKFAAKVNHHQQRHQIEPVAGGQQQRFAADLAVQLAKGNQRAAEGDGPNEDTNVDFHLVDGFLHSF